MLWCTDRMEVTSIPDGGKKHTPAALASSWKKVWSTHWTGGWVSPTASLDIVVGRLGGKFWWNFFRLTNLTELIVTNHPAAFHRYESMRNIYNMRCFYRLLLFWSGFSYVLQNMLSIILLHESYPSYLFTVALTMLSTAQQDSWKSGKILMRVW